MKKGISLVLVLVMCLSLCACGAEKQTVEINYGEEHTIELKKQQEGIVWETANPDIVTVQDGIVTGIAPGNAIVTAVKDGKTVAEISVSVNIIDISAILLSQKNVEIELEESMQLQYVLMPDNASDYGLSWKSANTEIAEVDDNGNIRAVAPGTTTIVCATPNGAIDTCEVVVKEPSAIEQLNAHELKFFDFLTKTMLPSFYNAPSARVNALFMITTDSSEVESVLEKTGVYTVEMQGTNRLGGTLKKFYGVMLSVPFYNASKEGFSPYSSDTWMPVPKDIMSVSKINAALEEYWANKGM